jgi:glutaredoxin 3
MAAGVRANRDGSGFRPAAPLRIDFYTSRFDVKCIRAKWLLDRNELAYNEYDVESDLGNRALMLKLTGGETSLPQIFLNGRSVGGFEELNELIESGDLDGFIGGAA